MTSAPLTLGVDGGATRCRARLRDGEGELLAEASGAAANIHVDFAAAIAVLRALVEEVLRKAGLGDADSGRSRSASGSPGSRTGATPPESLRLFPAFGSCAPRTTLPPPASARTRARTAGW